MKEALTVAAIVLSLALYFPLWRRLLRRRTSGDHSKLTWVGIFVLQFLGLGIAWLDDAPTLYMVYYPMHILLVGTTMGLVWRFWD